MADGFFQGGFARGMMASDELGLREQALELDQQSAAQENSRKIRTEALTERGKTLDALVKDIGVLKQGGNMSDADISRFANPFVRSIGQIDTLLGRDPSLVAQRIEALIRETPTPTQAAERKGRAAASEAISESQALQETGISEQAAEKAAGFGEIDEKFNLGEFRANLSLRAIGQNVSDATVGNLTPDQASAALQQLQGLEQQGFSIEVDKQGNVRVTQGPAGSLPKGVRIPGTRADEIRAAISATQTGSQITSTLLDQIGTNPQIFGLTGTARGIKQVTTGIMNDVARTVFDVAGINAKDAAKFFDDIISFERNEGTSEDVLTAIRPSGVGELAVLRSVLQYSVARALQPEGKLLKDAAERAGEITKLTGLTSSRQVAERLTAIQGFLAKRESDLQRRIEQGLTGEAVTESVSTPSGTSITKNEVQSLDASSARRLVRELSDEELEALPQEVKDALAEKMR